MEAFQKIAPEHLSHMFILSQNVTLALPNLPYLFSADNTMGVRAEQPSPALWST